MTQLNSTFFRLPAEIRLEIYQYLDFPPVDNEQCHGLILSCHQAREECEQVVVKNTRKWLDGVQRTVHSTFDAKVRILLPPLKPVGSRRAFTTIRELTLVFPSERMFTNLSGLLRSIYQSPVLDLALHVLRIHFVGNRKPWTKAMGEGFKPTMGTVSGNIFCVLLAGFKYRHDKFEQPRILNWNEQSWAQAVRGWKLRSVFMRKLVLSWALDEEDAPFQDMIALDGECMQLWEAGSPASWQRQLMSDDSCYGEATKESRYRLRPVGREDCILQTSSEHEKTCFECRKTWNYRRYMRKLPEDDDPRWI